MSKPKSLERRLAAHPQLKEKVEALLDLAEGDVQLADEAEELLIDLCRSVGKQALQDWATHQQGKAAEAARRDDPGLSSHGKKNSTG